MSSLHLQHKTTLTVVGKLLDMCLYSVCYYFIEDFYIHVHQCYQSVVLFYVCCAFTWSV